MDLDSGAWGAIFGGIQAMLSVVAVVIMLLTPAFALAWWGFQNWLKGQLGSVRTEAKAHLEQCDRDRQECQEERRQTSSQLIAVIEGVTRTNDKLANAVDANTEAIERLGNKLDQMEVLHAVERGSRR